MKNAVSQKTEDMFCRELLRTRPTFTKYEVVLFAARQIYQIAYYQANYPEEYALIREEMVKDSQ